MTVLLEDVFVTEGIPQYTFVKPPNYNDIFLDIRKAGKPVIIEGQSGTGKTTTAKKIIEQLGIFQKLTYLTARKSTDIEEIIKLTATRPTGCFIIDDFHRLPEKTQTELADIAKLAAEEGGESKLPKLVIIGINQVGTNLIHLVPDIAKRCGIHRIQTGSKEIISDLIEHGCTKLHIKINDIETLYAESKGDYWLTQHLCQAVCLMNDIIEEQTQEKEIFYNIHTLRESVVSKLESAYYNAVKEFCRGKRFRASNDPYYKLLKKVASQDSSIVDLNALANSDESVRGSINNIKEKRLNILLETKPLTARYFYYNSQTKAFAIEDPALFYFIKHLNWEGLRIDCGFRNDEKEYEFDIAISFAGENRQLAKFIAEQFEILDAQVFFDEHYEVNFLGKAWSEQFKRIFSNDSRLVVCLLDKYHKDKLWPTFERECFLPRVDEGAVIPIYLDDTKFVGIPSDIVGITYHFDLSKQGWQDEVTNEIVFKVMEKLEKM